VLERYIATGGNQAEEFLPFMPDLGRKDKPSLCGSTTFVESLKAAGRQPAMVEVQKQCFDELYLGPAFEWGKTYGFTLNLSFLTIADSYLHSGSMLGFLMAKFPERKPAAGGDEKVWITEYLNARKNWLAGHSNRLLNATVYRANCYLIEVAKGNWDLLTPVVMNGVSVARVA
jgi:chitosanase